MIKITKFLVILFITLKPIILNAQIKYGGARSMALANSSVSLSDIWGSFNNQAVLAELDQIQAGFFLDNKFMVKELSRSSLVIAVPVNSGTLSLNYSFFGYSQYNENKLGLAYSMQLFQNLYAAMQLDYFRTNIQGEFDAYNTFTAEVGILAVPAENLRLGIHLFNPVRMKKKTYDEEELPVFLRFGGAYSFSEQFTLLSEIEINLDKTTNFKAATEFFPVEKVALRLGVNTMPATWSFGVGYIEKKWQLDLSFSNHQILGYSSSVSAMFHITK